MVPALLPVMAEPLGRALKVSGGSLCLCLVFIVKRTDTETEIQNLNLKALKQGELRAGSVLLNGQIVHGCSTISLSGRLWPIRSQSFLFFPSVKLCLDWS